MDILPLVRLIVYSRGTAKGNTDLPPSASDKTVIQSDAQAVIPKFLLIGYDHASHCQVNLLIDILTKEPGEQCVFR